MIDWRLTAKATAVRSGLITGHGRRHREEQLGERGREVNFALRVRQRGDALDEAVGVNEIGSTICACVLVDGPSQLIRGLGHIDGHTVEVGRTPHHFGFFVNFTLPLVATDAMT